MESRQKKSEDRSKVEGDYEGRKGRRREQEKKERVVGGEYGKVQCMHAEVVKMTLILYNTH